MALLLKVAAAVTTVAGLATLYRGTDASLLSYGYTLMTVGAVFAGAGLVLFGLGVVAGRVDALRAALEAGGMAAPVPRPVAAPAAAPLAPAMPMPAMPMPAMPEAAAPAAPTSAPVPPPREAPGLRPVGLGAAAAATAAVAGAAMVAASAPAASAPAATPQPASPAEADLERMFADIHGAPKDPPPLVVDAVPAGGPVKAPAGAPGEPVAMAELDALLADLGPSPATAGPATLRADAGPSYGARKEPAPPPAAVPPMAAPVAAAPLAAAPVAAAAPAEPDPLASLSRALEDLSDEIARGGRPDAAAAPPAGARLDGPDDDLSGLSPEPASGVDDLADDLSADLSGPADRLDPVLDDTRPDDTRLDTVSAGPSAAAGDSDFDRDLADLIGRPEPAAPPPPEEPEEDLKAAPEPDSFLARLRRSMSGSDRKPADKDREEPVLAAAPAGDAGPAHPEPLDLEPLDLEPPLRAGHDGSQHGDLKVPAGHAGHHADDVASGEMKDPVFDEPPLDPAAGSSELDQPGAVSFSIEEEMERALKASLEDQPVLAPEPRPDMPAPRYSEPPRDPGLAGLARDFPELGDLLKPSKPSPADPADALIADLKGIFDGEDKAPARSEPAYEPSALPPRNPGAPLLREGVIAQIPFRLYGDGTIEADLPEGTTRFASLKDFRGHVGG